MSLVAVIEALHGAGIQPTGLEVAEALWLAEHLDPPSVPAAEPGPGLPADDGGHDAGTAPGSPSSADERVPLGTASPHAANSAVRGHPVGVPAIPGLNRRQEIQRALRPLRRYGPSRRRQVIDEDATATLIANTGVWTPVTRPEPERWFDAALIVDSSSSMDLWRPLVADLRTVLAGTGAFRDVRSWRLTSQGRSMVLPSGPMAAPRSPRELIDGAGRRLFFVVTDGAADGWHAGSAITVLAQWGKTGPVAILQALPEKMWNRTGLATVPVLLSTDAPGPRNSQLHIDSRRRRRISGVPVPVLGIEPNALGAWARLISGPAREVPLGVTPTGGDRPVLASSTRESEPGETMERFRESASPEAYQLAVCLSAVILNLPLMRLVQHSAVPGSNPSALAEVILGGLIYRTGDGTYEFREGIREELLGELRRSELVAVLSAASDYIAQHAGQASPTFPLLARRADGPVAGDEEVFSWVPQAVAARLGLPSRGETVPSTTSVSPSADGRESEDPTADDVSPGQAPSREPAPPPGQGDAPTRGERKPAPAVRGTVSPAGNLPPVFISYAYAGGESNGAAERFFYRLRQDLQPLIALPVGTDIGFFDTSALATGTRWRSELANALGTCQVLVSLLSVPYLQSEWCGREWHAFTLREIVPRPGTNGLQYHSSIIPVRWAPIPFRVPSVIESVQLFKPSSNRRHPDLPERYDEDGIFGLLQGGEEEAFQEIVWDLAKLIQQIYYSQLLIPKNLERDELRNVFSDSQK